MMKKYPGFNKENVVMVDVSQTRSEKIYPLFKQALSYNRDILGVASAGTGLGEGSGLMGHGFKYNGVRKVIYECFADYDYINVLGMQLLAGRNFSSAFADDTVKSVIINEAMVYDFGWTLDNAVGQQVKGFTNNFTPVVIGVIKNFNFQPLTEKVQPQLFHQFARHAPQKFLIRIKHGNPESVLAAIKQTWNKLVPDVPFKYSFLDDDLDNFYKAEQHWSDIIGYAGGFSIFLACLGLFGLAALAVINRIKEIGIRKVLGASVFNVFVLLSKDFLKLIVIAVAIACPVAWYFMNDWLQSFPYRTNIGWIIFAASGLFGIVVALLTISLHAVRAAVVNPVKSLGTE